MPAKVVDAKFWEDGSATIYGRLMARDGTGSSVIGEGKYVKQSDLSSITYKVFDVEAGTEIATGTVTISTSVFDTPQTSTEDPVWQASRGFNFRHDLAHTCFPTGGKVYRVEYLFITTGGTRGFAVFEGPAEAVMTS